MTAIPGGTSAVDTAVLDDLGRQLGAREEAEEILQMLLDSLEERLRALLQAERDGDAEVLRRVAHSLRSTSYQMGSVVLAGAAGRVEQGQADAESVLPVARAAEAEWRAWLAG
ncbi:Hpt domain-containing protein [Nocardioides sp. GY 10127]|uniref:Hpt domain-containing protein n=1 Tax=Nocardioides sp. GY 10127 TaxID=2569762 RepID=UPI0010A8BE8A|nr:Hpt domain-containing protein [Nocardioides sp. GY 10127]TIC84048.1 Hpt domain-containing protein [Nocardioides sp. GY 10127]